jgi:hypothetical protein
MPCWPGRAANSWATSLLDSSLPIDPSIHPKHACTSRGLACWQGRCLGMQPCGDAARAQGRGAGKARARRFASTCSEVEAGEAKPGVSLSLSTLGLRSSRAAGAAGRGAEAAEYGRGGPGVAQAGGMPSPRPQKSGRRRARRASRRCGRPAPAAGQGTGLGGAVAPGLRPGQGPAQQGAMQRAGGWAGLNNTRGTQMRAGRWGTRGYRGSRTLAGSRRKMRAAAGR